MTNVPLFLENFIIHTNKNTCVRLCIFFIVNNNKINNNIFIIIIIKLNIDSFIIFINNIYLFYR